MTAVRQAVMYVSRSLLESLLPEGKTIDCVADKLGAEYAWLAEAMKLPANVRITGVSMALRFVYDQVAIRVECSDFVETLPSNCLPEVQATYKRGVDGKGVFVRWEGPAMSQPAHPAQ